MVVSPAELTNTRSLPVTPKWNAHRQSASPGAGSQTHETRTGWPRRSAVSTRREARSRAVGQAALIVSGTLAWDG